MLPEIFRQKIHEHHGMGIFEYAAKFAGLSHDQVMTVLRLDQKFQSMPALKPLLENGEVSIHKLARISSIVTDENQEELAHQVQMLSKNAVETLVRDMKNLQNSSSRESSGSQNGLQKHLVEQEFLPGQELAKLKISQNVLKKLLELQNMGINLDELFEQAIKNRELEISAEKEHLSQQAKQTSSRYIKVSIRNVLQKEYGTKCSILSCKKPSQEIHHAQRFALSRMHDPKYLAPLCKEHHQIAHTIDKKYHNMRLTSANPSK